MRQDTKVLLDRLGQETFQYYDFESPSAETDVWPMFEALLLDERVVGKIARHSLPEPDPAAPEIAQPAPTERASPGPAVRRPAEPRGMFDNYDAMLGVEESGESVRDRLMRLVAPAR
jgi:hypothetical protein